MGLENLQLSVELGLWIGFLVFGGLLIVFRDWRIALPALLGEYFLLCALLDRFPETFIPRTLVVGEFTTNALVAVKAVTGLTVVGILTLTVISRRWARPPESEQALDEITEARLRWAARRMARTQERARFSLWVYLLPTFALAILIAATYALARLYPLVGSVNLPETTFWFYVDLTWYWLTLSGLFIVLFAREVQEICVGLLLCLAGVDLLYTTLSESMGLLAIGLLNAVSILLALGSAYLALLFYLRLQGWQLPSAEEWD
ncbi:MAG: hypothetical protein JXA37_09005 [Chloroflexia bacterium]|nr:hypothetical protein [Chloroflexia bacterium]